MQSNFDIGNTFKRIIYFLVFLIVLLLGIIVFFVIKNNEMAKEMREYTCETDVMEQEGLYNFIDSMDSVIFLEDYLDDRYPRECHYSKTIGEFANEFPYGKYAVSTNGHLTAIVNGYIMDTFDPSSRIMRCAWRID